ncbi:hypothetical protein MIR68_001923 [Amoeboaphelidium protococcarum]|nr:hypothetical protein MIR68_001923 [Amoeboaphelidium protococcarum]
MTKSKSWTEALRLAEGVVLGHASDIQQGKSLWTGVQSAATKLAYQQIISKRSSGNQSYLISSFVKRCQSSEQAGKFMNDFFYYPTLQTIDQKRSASSVSSSVLNKVSSPSSSPQVGHNVADLSFLMHNIKSLIECDHPLLDTMAKYYFDSEGKQVRPLLVMLFGRASIPDSQQQQQMNFNWGKHQTLASIIELIHTASLIHDDVLDKSNTRRLLPALHTRDEVTAVTQRNEQNEEVIRYKLENGNKLAILCGDYLLSRASVALAGLGNLAVVESVANIIGSLVEGEVLQMYNGNCTYDGFDRTKVEMVALGDEYSPNQIYHSRFGTNQNVPVQLQNLFAVYVQKSYLKTASLMAQACLASVQLHQQCDDLGFSLNQHKVLEQSAIQYGRHLGLAFQIMDDLLDYTRSSSELGKPSRADLQNGIITAPLLYSCLDHPELLQDVIDISQKSSGWQSKIPTIMQCIDSSSAYKRTKDLALWHVNEAKNSLSVFPKSEAVAALNALCDSVLNRNK